MSSTWAFWTRTLILIFVLNILTSIEYNFMTWQYWAILLLFFLQGVTFIVQED